MAIGVAILGSGIFAKEQHLPAVLASPDLELKAIYSRSLKSVQALGEHAPTGVQLYADEKESQNLVHLLQRDDIQAVIVALPILVQPDVIRQALAAGKHVLAEKPIAKDVATAEELLKYSKECGTKATFCIAENFRFFESFLYAASQVPRLGRVLNFRIHIHSMVNLGGKYIETAWRKVPEYQGGFLLDGGVHYTAGARLLLGATNNPENAPVRVSAFTNQLQPHLPPVDTVDSTWKIKSGATGTFSVSVGTTMAGTEYACAFENGTMTITRAKVVIKERDGPEETKEFPNEGFGVMQEVKAWGEALATGTPNPQQSPEEALKDLALIEAMLTSGDNDGAPVNLAWY